MIANLRGRLGAVEKNAVIVDVGGIGYLVFVTDFLVQTLRRGETISLLTNLIVREDSLTLFGFQDQEEVFLFQELIKVNGVTGNAGHTKKRL